MLLLIVFNIAHNILFFSNVMATIIAIYQTNPSLTVPNISLRVNIKIVQSHVYYSQTNEWKIGS